MTSTSTTPAPGTTAPIATDASRGTALRRRAAGTVMIGAGVVSLAGFLATPWENGSDTASYLRSLTSHPTQAMVAMALLHYGYLLFVPVAFSLARLARPRAPKLAAVGLVLSVLGSGLSGFLVTDAYDLSIGQHLPIHTAVTVSDGVPGGAMLAVAVPTIFGAMIGLVVLLVAMWRARWMSVVPAVAMLAGWAVSFGAHDLVRACTGFALVAIALVLTGTRVLRAGDSEFETGISA